MDRPDRLEQLVQSYGALVARPWDLRSGADPRVWFAVYDPADERRVRARLGDFEALTREAGRGWHACDFSGTFAAWLSAHRYREAYFESPHDLRGRLRDFRDVVAAQLSSALAAGGFEGVVAVTGLASLRGFVTVPEFLEDARERVLGRLLVLFPGSYEAGAYRLLDGRDLASYPVTRVSGSEGGLPP